MQKVVGVRFRTAGKIYYFDPGDDVIEKGEYVIVDTVRGLECGKVVLEIREFPEAEIPSLCNSPPPLRKIHRRATKADMARLKDNRENEKKAFDICVDKIKEHHLPMKLINVDYTFDVNKIIFYFTADGRVDFRELVRDLAYIFHTRIELRQVGVRDEAKVLGGTGCCGRPLCCASFLGDFAPVSIKMAKEQNLSLNPTKISGICGRLLCCLKYESEFYHEQYMEKFKSFQPEYGDRVILDEGEGRIVAVNAQSKLATVLLDTRKTLTVNWDDILPVESKKSRTEKFSGESDEKIIAEEISELVEDETEKVVASEKPRKAENNFGRTKNFNRKNSEVTERSDRRQNKHFDRSNKTNFNRPRRFGDFKK